MHENTERISDRGLVDPATSVRIDPTSSSDDIADIKRRSVRGGIVTSVAQVIGVLIQVLSTVVLARLLRPEEFGVVAMVAAVTAFAGLFRDLGLSSATIQQPHLTHGQLSTLYWINVAVGGALTVLLAAAAPLVAWFYGRSELVAVTMMLSLTFIVASFGTQQAALLNRHLQFRRLAVATHSGTLLTFLISTALALRGDGYWSLVIGGLSGSILTTLLLNWLSAWRPTAPVRGAGVRSMLAYGANITGFDLANYFHRNLDNILIGRFWGADALGLYSRAYQLLMFPIQNIRGPLTAVAFPAMSRLQTRPDDFRGYYRGVTHTVAFASMPLTAFLFVSSRPVIELLLGTAWLGAAPLFSVLAVVAFIQPPLSLIGIVNVSLGNARRHLAQGVLYALCVSAGFVAGVRWGAVGVAISYCIVTYLLAYPLLHWTFRRTALRPFDFFHSIARPMISSAAAASSCLLLQNRIAANSPLEEIGWRIVVFGAAFALTYISIPGGVRELRQKATLLQHLRSSSGTETSATNRSTS